MSYHHELDGTFEMGLAREKKGMEVENGQSLILLNWHYENKVTNVWECLQKKLEKIRAGV